MATLWLLSWNCNGLESCINITEHEKKQVWDVLSDGNTSSTLYSIVNMILLRARYNTQRHYEIYTVNVDDSITKDDLMSMFDADPQGMADVIRERGNKIYSDRFDTKGAKIV
jgi:hypothetical protein